VCCACQRSEGDWSSARRRLGCGGPPDLPDRVGALGRATSCSQIFAHRQRYTELSLERSFKTDCSGLKPVLPTTTRLA
jgi:hypothetical protein